MRYVKLAVLPVLVVGIAVAFRASLVEGDEPDSAAAPAANSDTPLDDVEPDEAGANEPSSGAQPAEAGLDRSEQGAVTAAVRFLELTEEVVSMSPEEGAALQRSISTGSSARQLSDEVAETLRAVQLDVPEGLAVTVAPVGVTALERGDGWDVSIWYVEVIVYGDQLAVEQWRTSTYSLEWENDEWRMSGLESVDGPTPVRPAAAVGSTTVDVAAAVAGMEDEVLVP